MGLSRVAFTIDLGRNFRLGSSIRLEGEVLKSLKFHADHPAMCSFSLANSDSNVYDSVNPHFPSTCTVGSDVESIEVMTHKYVPDARANFAFNRFVVITLTPVKVANLGPVSSTSTPPVISGGEYTLRVFLDSVSNLVAATPETTLTFPVSANPAGFYAITAAHKEGLCNLTAVMPRVYNTGGEYYFELDLTGSAAFLKDTVNKDGATKVINEVSILMHEGVWSRTMIMCYYMDASVPCNWS